MGWKTSTLHYILSLNLYCNYVLISIWCRRQGSKEFEFKSFKTIRIYVYVMRHLKRRLCCGKYVLYRVPWKECLKKKKAFVWWQGCIFHSFTNQLEKVLIAEVEKCSESTKLVQIRRGMKHQSDFAVLHDIRGQWTDDSRELKHATFLSHGRQPEVRCFRI